MGMIVMRLVKLRESALLSALMTFAWVPSAQAGGWCNIIPAFCSSQERQLTCNPTFGPPAGVTPDCTLLVGPPRQDCGNHEAYTLRYREESRSYSDDPARFAWRNSSSHYKNGLPDWTGEACKCEGTPNAYDPKASAARYLQIGEDMIDGKRPIPGGPSLVFSNTHFGKIIGDLFRRQTKEELRKKLNISTTPVAAPSPDLTDEDLDPAGVARTQLDTLSSCSRLGDLLVNFIITQYQGDGSNLGYKQLDEQLSRFDSDRDIGIGTTAGGDTSQYIEFPSQNAIPGGYGSAGFLRDARGRPFPVNDSEVTKLRKYVADQLLYRATLMIAGSEATRNAGYPVADSVQFRGLYAGYFPVLGARTQSGGSTAMELPIFQSWDCKAPQNNGAPGVVNLANATSIGLKSTSTAQSAAEETLLGLDSSGVTFSSHRCPSFVVSAPAGQRYRPLIRGLAVDVIWRLALDMAQKIEQGKIPNIQAYVRSNAFNRRNSHGQLLKPFKPWSHEVVLKRDIQDARNRYQALSSKIKAAYGNQVVQTQIKECGRANQAGQVTEVSESESGTTIENVGQSICLLAAYQANIETRMTLDYAFSIYQVLALHMLERMGEFYR
jgi:hypothetical protein